MIRLDTHAFIEAVWHAAWLQASPPPLDGMALKRLEHCIARCAANAWSMRLDSLAASAERVHVLLEDRAAGSTDELALRREVADFAGRVKSEFREELFLQVPSDARDLVDFDQPPFGHEVELAIPKAIDDIDEAAKCLALERATASVFHLMRVMEFALEAAVVALRIPYTDHAWDRVIAQISDAAHRHPDRSWVGVVTRLYLVKRSWLNDRMQPRYAYTQPQAQEVYRSVRSFVTHLSPLV